MLKVPNGGSMVLLRTPGVAFDKQDAARRLAQAAGVPFYDAINVLGHHHGRILAEDLQPDVAQRWGDELQRLGLPVAVLHNQDLLRPVFAGHALRIQYDQSHFEAVLDRGTFQLGWNELMVVAVGQVDVVQEDPCDLVDLNPPQQSAILPGFRQSAPPLAHPKVAEKVLMVEILGTQCIRLNARQLTYTHLGPRMQPSSTDNMRQTVKDMVGLAPRAARTEAVDKFLQGCLLHDIHYPDLPTFQEHARWLLQARHQGWLGTDITRPANRFDALEL